MEGKEIGQLWAKNVFSKHPNTCAGGKSSRIFENNRVETVQLVPEHLTNRQIKQQQQQQQQQCDITSRRYATELGLPVV